MTPTAVLATIVVVPVTFLMLLRINAALVFLSLCLGSVLVQFVAPDANSFLALFSAHVPKGVDTGNNTIKLILLLVPAILTAIFMIRTVHGHGKLALNLLPALGVGLLAGLLVVPLLPADLSHNIIHSQLWGRAQNVQDIIVGASAIVCLFALWVQRPKAPHEGKHGKKHKG